MKYDINKIHTNNMRMYIHNIILHNNLKQLSLALLVVPFFNK